MSKNTAKGSRSTYNPTATQPVRKEMPEQSGRTFFTLVTLLYLAGEGYHFFYNIQVIN